MRGDQQQFSKYLDTSQLGEDMIHFHDHDLHVHAI
jgi:hypothetical protein